jgi:hypothetical protein
MLLCVAALPAVFFPAAVIVYSLTGVDRKRMIDLTGQTKLAMKTATLVCYVFVLLFWTRHMIKHEPNTFRVSS